MVSAVEVNFWAAQVPDVEAVRPRVCPCCQRAGRPLGAPLVLVGHGTRTRQVRGPRTPGARAEMLVLTVRRYRCRACGAVLVVVPRGVAARRHFGIGAIALALLRYGLGERVVDIREAVGGLGETASWPQLRRWVRAVRRGALFPDARGSPAEWTARKVAERAARRLAACAPPGAESLGIEACVFAGAAHAA